MLTVVSYPNSTQDGKRAQWWPEKRELHAEGQLYALGQQRSQEQEGTKLARSKMPARTRRN